MGSWEYDGNISPFVTICLILFFLRCGCLKMIQRHDCNPGFLLCTKFGHVRMTHPTAISPKVYPQQSPQCSHRQTARIIFKWHVQLDLPHAYHLRHNIPSGNLQCHGKPKRTHPTKQAIVHNSASLLEGTSQHIKKCVRLKIRYPYKTIAMFGGIPIPISIHSQNHIKLT